MHAVIEVSGPGDISIIDLGSTKGTIVNGQKVNKAKLQDGDLIVLGDIRIELAIGAPSDEDDADPGATLQAAPPAPLGPRALRPPASLPPPPAAPAATRAAPCRTRRRRPRRRRSSSPVAPPPRRPPPPPRVAATGGRAGAGLRARLGRRHGRGSRHRGRGHARRLGRRGPHVSNPRGGKVTGTTYALFAGGAALLVIAMFAFFIGAGQRAREQAVAGGLDRRPAQEPGYDWRPHRISLAYDWMAFGGLIGGLVCVTMGLIRLRNEKQSPFFRIGRGPGRGLPHRRRADGVVPAGGAAGRRLRLQLHPADARRDDCWTAPARSLAELAGQGRARASATAPGAMEVPIPHRARFRVTAGQQTFLVSSVPAPRKHATPLFATIETAVLAFFGGSLLLHVGCHRAAVHHPARLDLAHRRRHRQRGPAHPGAGQAAGGSQDRAGEARLGRLGRLGRHRHQDGARRGQDGQEGVHSPVGPVRDEEQQRRPAAGQAAGHRQRPQGRRARASCSRSRAGRSRR